MAVKSKDVSITREDIYQWLIDAKKKDEDPADRIREEVDKLNLSDRKVDVSQRDDFNEDEKDIADLIILDLDSYIVP